MFSCAWNRLHLANTMNNSHDDVIVYLPVVYWKSLLLCPRSWLKCIWDMLSWDTNTLLCLFFKKVISEEKFNNKLSSFLKGEQSLPLSQKKETQYIGETDCSTFSTTKVNFRCIKAMLMLLFRSSSPILSWTENQQWKLWELQHEFCY